MIRDLRSNFVRSIALAVQELAASTEVISSTIDMSKGTTGSFLLSLETAAGNTTNAVVIEYSDSPTIGFKVDDGTTGNTIVDAAGADVASPVSIADDTTQLFLVNIVNPLAKYYRIKVTSDTEAMSVSAVGLVGPLRYVAS